MAIFEYTYKIGLTDVGKSNKMTNKAILKALENAAGAHSEEVGYGLNEIEKTSLSWILLNWKVQVKKRALYNTTITIKTWARDSNRATTYRDYEIYNEEGELIVIATSKWTIINMETMALTPLTDEIIDKYIPEKKSVFEDKVINKMKEPADYSIKKKVTVERDVIDINNHVHNLYYLDFAYSILPDDVYEEECSNIEIMYKKEIKFRDELTILYSKKENKNIISIKNEDEKILHSIIKLY